MFLHQKFEKSQVQFSQVFFWIFPVVIEKQRNFYIVKKCLSIFAVEFENFTIVLYVVKKASVDVCTKSVEKSQVSKMCNAK